MTSNRLLKTLDLTAFWVVARALLAFSWLLRLFSRRWRSPTLDPAKVRSVLVIKLCCLGDGLLAVPAIRALKARFPSARLTVLCTRRNDAVFEGLPYVDELVRLEVTGIGGLRELVWTAPRELWRAIRRIRACRPEVAADLDLYYRITPVLAFLAGSPVRAGFDTEGQRRGVLLTHRAPRRRDCHEVECFLHVVATIGVEPVGTQLELAVPPEREERARRLLEELGLDGTPVVALFPGSSRNWPVKQWPAQRFAEVADRLAQGHGLQPLILGASYERDIARQVASHMAVSPRVAAGRTDIKTLAAVLRRCTLLISNDTGPMHLAAAVGLPVVGIFGMTNERKWRPWGDQHEVVTGQCDQRPCYYLSNMPRCDHLQCVRDIAVDDVYAAAERILTRASAARADVKTGVTVTPPN